MVPSESKMGWKELLTYITPVGMVIMGWLFISINGTIGVVHSEIKDTNAMMMHHLTNSEIHIPRATVVSRDEFIIYQQMRDKQMDALRFSVKEGFSHISELLNQHMQETEFKPKSFK